MMETENLNSISCIFVEYGSEQDALANVMQDGQEVSNGKTAASYIQAFQDAGLNPIPAISTHAEDENLYWLNPEKVSKAGVSTDNTPVFCLNNDNNNTFHFVSRNRNKPLTSNQIDGRMQAGHINLPEMSAE